jgi:hypothetical protein
MQMEAGRREAGAGEGGDSLPAAQDPSHRLTSTTSSPLPLLFIALPSSALPLLSFFCSEVNYIAYACLDLGLGYTPLMWYAACAWIVG